MRDDTATTDDGRLPSCLRVTHGDWTQLITMVQAWSLVDDWSVFWHEIDRPYGAAYANRVSAHTGWQPVVSDEVTDRGPVKVDFLTSLGACCRAADGTRVAGSPTGVQFIIELVDAPLGTDESVLAEARGGVEWAHRDVTDAMAEIIGTPTEPPAWVAPAAPLPGYPAEAAQYVSWWRRKNGVVALSVRESPSVDDEPYSWLMSLVAAPTIGKTS